MSDPTLTRIGERLRERTAPLAPSDEDHGWAHAHLAAALAAALDQVAEVFDPEDPIPPGAPLLDVDLCPEWALPWLAQIVGVRIPASATAEQARILIRDVAGWTRGTPAALEAAAGLFLTGDKTVTFRERDQGDPYALEVVTLVGETPDPAATLAALEAQKPGGIVLHFRTVAGQDWQAVQESGRTWRQARTTYASWRDMRDNV